MKKYYLPLIGAALAAASLFQLSLPTFAAGTSAGTGLVNKATATYSDEEDNSYDVISNEVTVTVGKVAGITNVEFGNTSTGPILPGQSVGFDFKITNTGNDVSSIFIPNAANIATTNATVTSVQYRLSSETDADFKARPTTDDGIIPNIAADDFIIVRVNVTVASGLTDGTEIAVQLGNTGENDNSVDTQNQPDGIASVDDLLAEDVRTVTADPVAFDGTSRDPKVTTEPVNGQREASAVNSTTVNAEAITLARITKDGVLTDPAGTPTDVSDNIITYNLALNVFSSGLSDYGSSFSYNFKGLEGRNFDGVISTDAGTEAVINPDDTAPDITDLTNLILVSDAIPKDTTLDVGSVTSPSANWIPIYTQSPLTISASDAEWYEDPTELPAVDGDGNPTSPITRIGWVYNATATDAATPGNGPIALNSNLTGFSFEVETTGLTGSTDVHNLAQIFGTTDDGADGVSGTAILDESGDLNPSNFNDVGTSRSPQTTTTDSGATATYYGYAIADPGDNVDPGASSGTGDAGEFDETTVTLITEATSSILNGPGAYDRPGSTPDIAAAPDALGKLFGVPEADDNHDFQNISTATPAIADNSFTDGEVTTTYDPAAKTFNNSIQNNDISSTDPVDVVLEPINPGYSGLGGTAGDLPANTKVLIQYGTQAAQYTYDGAGTFALDATTTTPIVSGVTLQGTPVTITGIEVGETENYTVTVDLPASTPLSTNIVGGEVVGGYPVPIIAYIDEGDAGLNSGTTIGDSSAESHNVTINQVYTGFIQLEKTATIFGLSDPSDDTSSITEVTRDPIPGDIIQYDITYTNISEEITSSETGSLQLQADDLLIYEDGTGTDVGNTWGLDSNTDGIIDTLHVVGEAGEVGTDGNLVDPSSIAVRYSDDTDPFDVTTTLLSESAVSGEIVKYRFGAISDIDPGESGTVRFQRKVTESSDSSGT